MALTRLQKKIVVTLLDGGLIRAHLRPNDQRCWRLLNNEYKPLRNLPDVTVSRLLSRQYIERTESGIKACEGVYRSASGRVYNSNQSINQFEIFSQEGSVI